MPERGGLARGGAALGIGSALSNVLGYAITVVLARAFGPAEYGALVALLGAGLIGTIPATGLQYVVARRTVSLRLPPGRNDGATLALAAAAGVGLLVIAGGVAPLAKDFLHLSGVGPVLALGAMLVPMTVSGAIQGGLLGHQRLVALSGLYVVTALGRFLAGVLTAAAGWSVTGAMASLAGAALVSAVLGLWLTGPRSWGLAALPRGWLVLRVERGLAGDLSRASSAVAGLVVLSNVDLLLARHYLPAETSGTYGVASLFAKAMLWGTQFIAQAVFSSLARPDRQRRLLGRAVLGTAVFGLVGVLLTALAAGPVVRLATGQGYGESTRLAPWFALLGLCWALAQVLLLASVAGGERTAGRLLWLVIAAEAGAVAIGLHTRPAEILAACLVSAGWYILVAALLARAVSAHPPGEHRAEDASPPEPAAPPEPVPSALPPPVPASTIRPAGGTIAGTGT